MESRGMTRITEASSALHSISWRKVWRRLLARLKHWGPFAAGIAAALLGLMLYNAVNPPAEPLTMDQVNSAVAQAMASSTPAPAYSAQVVQCHPTLAGTSRGRRRG